MKQLFSRDHSVRLIPFLVLIATIALRLAEPDFIQREELMVFDSYQRLQPRHYQPLRVKIVDIDDDSLKKIGQWPWSRWRLAQLLDKLIKARAKVIGFDMMFVEADRNNLDGSLELWQTVLSKVELQRLADKLVDKPSFDQILARVMATTPVVLGFSLSLTANSEQPAVKAAIALAGATPKTALLNSRGAVKNLSLFEQAAAGNGSFNIVPEIDGVIRRLPLVIRFNDTYYPSLALELLRVAQGESLLVVKSQSGFIDSIKVGQSIIPTDSTGNLLMYYTKQQPQRVIPAWQILENKVDANELRDAIVLIGTSATGLRDQRATPLNPFVSGVEIHANAVEQMLEANYLHRPAWLLGLEICVTTLMGCLLIGSMSRFNAVLSAVLLLLLITTVIGSSWYAFQQHHWLIDPIYPSLTAVVLYFTISLLNYIQSEQARKHAALLLIVEEHSRLQAQQQNRDKSKFIANAAHDLKNAMQPIGDFLQASQYSLQQGDITKSQQLIEETIGAAHAMRTAFNAMLDISLLDSGFIKPNYSGFDGHILIEELSKQMQPIALKKGVTLHCIKSRQARAVVRSDRDLLYRVLANLISNGIKYADLSKGQRATVVIGIICLPMQCRITVLDNGIGIPQNELTNIFKPLHQLDNPERDREKGLGLGLAIVNSSIRLLAEHHITVTSAKGLGTRFSISLPRTDELSEEKRQHLIQMQWQLDGIYVLLIENDALVRKSMSALLNSCGALCVAVGSVAELATVLPTLERDPDLLLTDYRLPDACTAVDAIITVRAILGYDLPCIVITGEVADLSALNELQDKKILHKPVETNLLLTAINQLCQEMVNPLA